ncbi:MAG: biopolymer transporter ExbD [Bacteroidales bacterium]|jgi:biopolymer transport protein ExbD|nr:biopolymer transporter ExbD [Bacteroidales bacterium]
MAIRTRNKIRLDFNMASMADLVFLLLIFFMLTSTLVSPNAVKLLLPTSNSKTMAKPATVTVYIDDKYNYYFEDKLISIDQLETGLKERLYGETDASIVLRADKSVELQYVVSVIDAVNNVNDYYGAKNKVILATRPPK